MSAVAIPSSGKTRTAALAGLMVVAMAALGYASVPLYRMFCQATGYAGTTQRAEGKQAPGAVAGHTITIRFDANHAPALKWMLANGQTIVRASADNARIAPMRPRCALACSSASARTTLARDCHDAFAVSSHFCTCGGGVEGSKYSHGTV